MSARSLSNVFEDEEGGSTWIVTFADMMTLILVFFILLYTLADFEDEAYKELIESVQVIDGDGNQISVIDFATRKGRNPQPLKAIEDMLGLNPSQVPVENLKPALVAEMESMIDNTDLAESVELTYNGDQIILQIDGRYLFESGQSELKDRARFIFANLAQMFRDYADYKIAIRGHTDDQGIQTARFPSNWELSAVRATTVLRYFIQRGIDPRRMTATGYADYLPLVENNSSENRARNRRVEFVLEKEKDI
ncbi:MAG: OmpA family protein [Gammaproteobacteria bacterium]|nr:OmpA family protein [Gammaproteobacteria bacterium]MDH3858961.1 OmpA family protein [Gammaproteobacteria bacterium]